MLIAAGVDVNIQNVNGHTALINGAASKGHKEIVKVLIAAGADLNIKTKHGNYCFNMGC